MAGHDQTETTSPAVGSFSSSISKAGVGITHLSPILSESPGLKTLKRPRPEQNNFPTSAPAKPKSPRFAGSFTAAPLTGAAALADQRRRKEQQQQQPSSEMSDNPGHLVLSSLIAGGGAGMSKPSDAPMATTALSAPMTTVANSIHIPTTKYTPEASETSPASVTSLASLASTAQTATASTTAAASPLASTLHGGEALRESAPKQASEVHAASLGDHASSRAFSYPGQAVIQAEAGRSPARGMSLPMSGLNQNATPRSPSNKKHKCPYCETEFTRHHNLKSHLLTHSQEKPYICQTCQMRFRRLHDLKRHSKLHTGERPHICPKCDRKFARGDALARHAKGQGGCAGRRASMGSFQGDDDYDGSQGDGSGMEGVMYTEPEQTIDDVSEEDARRFSLPSIKAHHVHSGSSHDSYTSQNRTPSTYPPAGPRPRQNTAGSLYPPGHDHGALSNSAPANTPGNGGSGHSANISLSSLPSAGGGFSQGGMTESPKPLSPGGMAAHQLGHDTGNITRQRSPSLTTQFQQQHFGRRDSSRSSPQMSLPSPHGQKPQLPSLSGLAPPTLAPPPHYTTVHPAQQQQQHQPNGASMPGPPGQPMQTGSAYQPPMSTGGAGRNSMQGITHQQGGGSRDGSNNMFAGSDNGLWQYVQSLEEKIRQLSDRVQALETSERMSQDKILQLQQELAGARSQPPGGLSQIRMQQ